MGEMSWQKQVMKGRVVEPPDENSKKRIAAGVARGDVHCKDPTTGRRWVCPFCDFAEGFQYDRGFQRCVVCAAPGQ